MNILQKGTAHILLVLFLLSQFQLGTLYADTQSKLETSKTQTIQVLEQVEQVVDQSIDKIDAKIVDEDQSERLREKEQEIKQYIEATQEAIEDSHTQKSISNKVKEAEKVIVLKIVSGVTKYENVEDNISEAVATTPEEKKQAVETIQDSLETKGGDYTIHIKTKYNALQTLKLLKKFDPKLTLDFLYSNTQENYFEVTVDENSLFKKEMLEDIENGDIPEKFLGIEIVQPEVFSIALTPTLSLEGEGEEQVDLSGEQLNLTWGIQKYLPETYLEQLSTSGNTIKVGVVDTGIDYTHPDLKNNTTQGYDFVNDDNDAYDDQGHGTHVAGTIGANINQEGIIGVNPYVELVPLKICNQNGFCPTYAVTQALSYAKENNIDILNMSLGGATNPTNNPICDGITSYTQQGGIVVAASGNSNTDTNTFVPGGCADTITVSAIDQNNQRASFSNYGSKVDISAPGVNIYSTYPTNKGSYKSLNGTSMATPHVAGFISVLKTLDPTLTTQTTKTLLTNYQLPTHTEDTKPIAHAIDVVNLVASFNTPEEDLTPALSLEEREEEVVEEEVVVEEVNTGDDAEVVIDLEFIENQKAFSQEEENIPVEVQEDVVTPAETIQINVFGNEESLQTLSNQVPEITSLTPNTETKKIFYQAEDIQYFGPNGKIEEGIETNSIEQPSPQPSPTGEGEETTQEIYLGGAQKPIQINSDQSPQSKLLEITPYTNELEPPTDLTPLTLPVEKISYETQGELYIDGAQKGVQINSLSNENAFVEYDETNIELENPEENPENQEIPAYLLEPEDDDIQEYVPENTTTPILPELKQDDLSNYDTPYDEIIEKGEIYELPEDSNGIGIQNSYYCEIYVGQICNYNIAYAYSYSNQVVTSGIASVSTSTHSIGFYGNKVGTTQVIMSRNGIQYHTVDIKVIPTPPQEVNIEVYEGQNAKYTLYNTNNYEYQYSNGEIIDFDTQVHALLITGKNEGTEQIQVKLKSTGEHKYNINIHVKALPEPVEYNVTSEEYQDIFLSLPASNYAYYQLEYKDYGRGALYYNASNLELKIQGRHAGNLTYHVYDSNNIEIYTIHHTVTPKTLTIIEKELYVGKYFYQYIPSADQYTYTLSQEGIVSLRPNSKYLYIDGIQPGTAEIQAIYKGVARYIFKVRVLEVPEPQEYHVSVEQEKTLELYFPAVGNYSYQETSLDGGSATRKSMNTGYLLLEGHTPGKTTYHIYDTNKIKKYIVHITILPTPPEVRTFTMDETKYVNTNILYHDISLSVSQEGAVRMYKGYLNKLYIESIDLPGDQRIVEVYIKDKYGRHTITLELTINPKPEPTTYQVDLIVGGSNRLYLPVQIDDYEVEISNMDIFPNNGTHLRKDGRYLTETSQNNFNITTFRIGESTIYLKDHRGFAIYQINITVKPYEVEIEMNQTDRVWAPWNSTYSYQYENEPITNFTTFRGSKVLRGNQVGTTKIYGYIGSNLRSIHHVTVHPIPAPTELECNTIAGLTCKFKIDNNGYTLTPSKPNIVEVTQYDNALRINTNSSGTATIYVKSNTGEYNSHKLTINISPVPVQTYDCTIPEGLSCETYAHDDEDTYEFAVSNPGIVELSVWRYIDTPYRKYHIQGLQQGATDIYIYRNGDHVATIQTEVLEAIQPIQYTIESKTIDQGETTKGTITTGGGGYEIESYDSDILYADIDQETNADTDEITYSLEITGKQPGTGYITIKDQYNQKISFGVRVKDVSLLFSRYDITLNPGQTEELYIHEYYKGIQPLKKSNNNINVYLETDTTSNHKYLRIVGVQTGESIIEVEDVEGNKKTIRVTVGGGSTKPDPESPTNPEEPGTPEEPNQEEDLELDDFVKEIFDELSGSGGVEINSAETDAGQENIENELGLQPGQIEKLNALSESIKKRIDDKFQDTTKKIIITQKFIELLENTKAQLTILKNQLLFEYVIYNFIEYKEEYQFQLYRGSIDNPFEKMYATELKLLTKKLEADILMRMYVNKEYLSLEFLDEQYGGMFSKNGLDFLYSKNILTTEEYNQFTQYSPTIESILTILETEGSTHELIKAYFPEKAGSIDGFHQSLEDYLVETIALLDIRDTPKLLYSVHKGFQSIIFNGYTGVDLSEDLKETFGELYEIVVNIDEIVAGLSDYDQSFYKSYAGTSLSLAWIPANKYGKVSNTVKGKTPETMGKIKERRKAVNHHLQSPFLQGQYKISNKGGRPRYDNGESGSDRIIYEWDASHGGEIEVYEVKGSKGVHIGVYDPDGNYIKPPVSGRTIDL